jgi:2-keto-4-pentenoate hydratase
MAEDRITAIATALAAAHRTGTRVTLPDHPRDFDEAFAVQAKVVAALGAPVIGWKVNELPDKRVTYAPILKSEEVAAGGTWRVTGGEPAGIELEIAFRMGADVPPGATRDQILDSVASAHVVFELCQSRIADPANVPRHVALADSISNAGVTVGSAITNWRKMDHRAVPGRLLVDGKLHAEGKSADPFRALEVLPGGLAVHGKALRAGDIVITGSLIGLNWLKGRHALRGIIDGMGEVAMNLEA